MNECLRKKAYVYLTVGKQNIEGAFKNTKSISAVKCGNIIAEAWWRSHCEVNPELEEQHQLLGHTLFPVLFICINEATAKIHTEPDHTYRMIYVPPQEGLGFSDSTGTTFSFYLDGGANEQNTL